MTRLRNTYRNVVLSTLSQFELNVTVFLNFNPKKFRKNSKILSGTICTIEKPYNFYAAPVHEQKLMQIRLQLLLTIQEVNILNIQKVNQNKLFFPFLW
jgi:hypothetical protein